MHKTTFEKRFGSRVMALMFFAGLMCSFLTPAYATQEKCTRHDAIRAETEAPLLKSWPDVFASYKRYRQCDDGAIGEAYSGSIARLLADHWDQFEDLSALSGKYPRFKAFVLRHVDETMTSVQRNEIEKNIRSHCPSNSTHLCNAIKERLKQTGAE